MHAYQEALDFNGRWAKVYDDDDDDNDDDDDDDESRWLASLISDPIHSF